MSDKLQEDDIKLQVAISVLQGIIEAKGGIVAEIVPSIAVAESLRFADEFYDQWQNKYNP